MTTALYRRYRPDTFADVIGQEHVTEPLMQALRADKVTHAYLFSGPRGCGKTTSARILARCLNCIQGPTPEPCGQCDSCVELARGGAGSLDVVEIDAASHGGVDDARDLRERATFAPARDRYKVFILDEAHMVTSQGFNALLKIVEEPPEHVKFIFATTEPDKVIGTIRSRTHHYPFRLVGPATLLPYLEQICQAESVPVGSGVLPLVVRAGGGSVRDSLSVLDQLVAGADEGGIDYERAVALLGFTHAALLDDVVDAIAARDGASAFRVVDRVVSSGHEPRRFVEDLLERLRDLIVIAASGESAGAVLRELPADQLERMRAQASGLGAAELSRSADLANTALTEMTGATSPRLHLELLVARLLLPAADDGVTGLAARLDRVERALGSGLAATGAAGGRPSATGASGERPSAMRAAAAPVTPAPATAPVSEPASSTAGGSEPTPPAAADTTAASADSPAVAEPVASAPEAAAPGAGSTRAATPDSGSTEAAAPKAATPTPEPSPLPESAATAQPGDADASGHQQARTAGGVEAETVRRRWPEVLDTLRGLRMATWVLVSQNAQVTQVTAQKVTLGFTTPQLATTFRSGTHAENVQRALHETLGLEVRVETGLAGGAGEGAASGAADGGSPAGYVPSDGTPSTDVPSSHGPRGAGGTEAASAEPRGSAEESARRAQASWDTPSREALPAESAPESSDEPPGSAEPSDDRGAASVQVDDGGDAAPDDPDLNASGLVGAPLVAQMLGGTVIDEIPDPPG